MIHVNRFCKRKIPSVKQADLRKFSLLFLSYSHKIAIGFITKSFSSQSGIVSNLISVLGVCADRCDSLKAPGSKTRSVIQPK